MHGPLEPELLLEVVRRAKKQIRARMKALRGAHSPRALAARSKKIVEALLELPQLKEAQSVALFWPMTNSTEVDLRPLDTELRKRGIQIYYPFMEKKSGGGYLTGFRLTRVVGELSERGNGFFEPNSSSPLAARGEIDLVIVPALAADAQGHRIGYGAGYYDATLGDVCPPARSIIVAYQFQLLAELPVEAHDVPCEGVITDSSYYPASS